MNEKATIRLIIKLKSGYVIPVECEGFEITKHSITGEMTRLDIKGVKDNRLAFVRLSDVECIIQKMNGDSEPDCPWR